MTRESLSTHFMIERILLINRRIERGDYPNAPKLAEEMECSIRTIYRDIDFIRTRLNAPIKYDSERHGYYYSKQYCLTSYL